VEIEGEDGILVTFQPIIVGELGTELEHRVADVPLVFGQGKIHVSGGLLLASG
jgi:hypothetical protein